MFAAFVCAGIVAQATASVTVAGVVMVDTLTGGAADEVVEVASDAAAGGAVDADPVGDEGTASTDGVVVVGADAVVEASTDGVVVVGVGAGAVVEAPTDGVVVVGAGAVVEAPTDGVVVVGAPTAGVVVVGETDVAVVLAVDAVDGADGSQAAGSSDFLRLAAPSPSSSPPESRRLLLDCGLAILANSSLSTFRFLLLLGSSSLSVSLSRPLSLSLSIF